MFWRILTQFANYCTSKNFSRYRICSHRETVRLKLSQQLCAAIAIQKKGNNCLLSAVNPCKVPQQTMLSLINTIALLFIYSSHYNSIETKCLRTEATYNGHTNLLYINTLALYSWQHLPLVVLTVGIANTTPLSLHQASIILNDLVTLMKLLLQHRASTCTFKDTEHLCLILLLVYQQVAIGKDASCLCSCFEKWALPSTLTTLKTYTMFLWQPRRQHFTLAKISITDFERIRSDF